MGKYLHTSTRSRLSSTLKFNVSTDAIQHIPLLDVWGRFTYTPVAARIRDARLLLESQGLGGRVRGGEGKGSRESGEGIDELHVESQKALTLVEL